MYIQIAGTDLIDLYNSQSISRIKLSYREDTFKSIADQDTIQHQFNHQTYTAIL